jgi:hypothetical protein
MASEWKEKKVEPSDDKYKDEKMKKTQMLLN